MAESRHDFASPRPRGVSTGADTKTALHPFDIAVALDPLGDGCFRGRTSEQYWNMISPFGGLTAATVLNAVLSSPARQGDPIALTINFAAPIQRGEFDVEARLLRANRTTQHWSVAITQGDAREVATSAIAVIGARRPTWGSTEAVRPDTRGFDASRRLTPAMKMSWPAMYDLHLALGEFGKEGGSSLTHTWVRDAEPRPLDFLSLTAYSDTFAPRIFFRRPKIVPVGTVSMNVYYHIDAEDLARLGTEHVLGVAQGRVAYKGYADHEGQLWSGDTLLATTQQTLWYKE